MRFFHFFQQHVKIFMYTLTNIIVAKNEKFQQNVVFDSES